jgi:hypothetical protein
MRHLGVVLLTAAAVATAAPARAALAIGGAIPDAATKMKNVDGRELAIADVAGAHGTLVIFTCNHCPWVRAWESRIVALAGEAAKRGIGVIAINSNDPAVYPGDGFQAMIERAKAESYDFPYVMDTTSNVGRAFGATHTPEAFLFDAKGKLAYHGAIDDNARDASHVTHRYLHDAIVAVSDGQPPVAPETKALGCSLQFRPR